MRPSHIHTHIPYLAILLFLSALALSSPDAGAQCKSFVKNSCLSQLPPYIHDGSFQAVIMSEGEEAEVYKTIFAGQHYRLYVCAEDVLPNIEFVVSDIHRNILFDNRKNGNVRHWDFKSDASQQIKITIRVPRQAKIQGETEPEMAFGCVGLLFGFLEQ